MSLTKCKFVFQQDSIWRYNITNPSRLVAVPVAGPLDIRIPFFFRIRIAIARVWRSMYTDYKDMPGIPSQFINIHVLFSLMPVDESEDTVAGGMNEGIQNRGKKC
jgi:hypothetical protein